VSAKTIKQEILDWVTEQGKHYANNDYDVFCARLEWDEVPLPSGIATYVDTVLDVGDGESMFIFDVAETNYGIRGTYSSWGSDWDSDPIEVVKREVTIERWEAL
jgi:hypothetical protein